MQAAVGIPDQWEKGAFSIISWALSTSRGSTVGFRQLRVCAKCQSGACECVSVYVPVMGVVDHANHMLSVVRDPMFPSDAACPSLLI